MAKFHERLNEAMRIRNINQAELCQKTKIGKSAMSQYVSGKFTPKQKRTYLIAKALNVSVAWIMGADVPMDDDESIEAFPSQNVYLRPIYDSVAAGFNVLAQNTVVGYMPTYIASSSEREKYIWVNVVGDSMSPLIDDGAKVLVRLQESVDSGQIAVVLIDGEEGVVKKVVYGDDWIELHSVNPYYPPRRFDGVEVQRIRIIGLVKEVSKTLN